MWSAVLSGSCGKQVISSEQHQAEQAAWKLAVGKAEAEPYIQFNVDVRSGGPKAMNAWRVNGAYERSKERELVWTKADDPEWHIYLAENGDPPLHIYMVQNAKMRIAYGH